MSKRIKCLSSVVISTLMILQMLLPTAVFAADTDYVCYIGQTGYESLASAVAAANAGDTIWMTADDEVTNNVTIDKSLVIELDGHTLSDAALKFSGDITVKLNDRVGTAKFNTSRDCGFNVTDYTKDARLRAPLFLSNGANVIITGSTSGTEFFGGATCTDGLRILEKVAAVGKNCSLTVNGARFVYSGYTGTDGVFVCNDGTMTLNDIEIARSSSSTGGCSVSYASAPTTANPLTIVKGHFYGGMWMESASTINGVTFSSGRLSFEKIEKAFLYTSEGSYIDYDKSTSSGGWEIYIASNKLSTDTDIDTTVDTTEALRVSAGGDVTANEGQKVVFEPQVTGGDGESAITYSWSFNGANTGTATADYTIASAASSDVGTYVFTASQGDASVSCTYNLAVNAASVTSKLFSTSDTDNLLTRAVDSKFTNTVEEIKGVSFVDLTDYDLSGKTTADYSADGDGSVLAWYDNTAAALYIGGYGEIIAGPSLSGAFYHGESIDYINGLDLLNTSNTTNMADMFLMCGVSSTVFSLDLGSNFDTSNVTDMSSMFDRCGEDSVYFKLNLGDKFDTSKVTDMNCMFARCGYSSTSFQLDLGDKFDTSNVTNMCNLFSQCGRSSTVFTMNLGDKFNTEKVTDMSYMFCSTGEASEAFTVLDLSGFEVNSITRRYNLSRIVANSPVTTIVFGEGWANAPLPPAGSAYGFAYTVSNIDTTIIGAPKNLLSYDWAKDNRTVTFPGKNYYTITAVAENGGTVSGGGEKVEGSSVTLTATANDGYTFDGWYDGDTKVGSSKSFTIDTVTEDKTYTAKFAVIVETYTITSAYLEGGTAEGGGVVEEGGSITLTATPNEGYVFDGWYFDDTKVCDTEIFVIENVTSNGLYIAHFKKIVYRTITATAGEGGTVSGGGEVLDGESATLTATANDGYTFDGWYDGDTKVCDTAEFTVENVSADKTYTANFAKAVSRLFSTNDFKTLLSKIKDDGISTYDVTKITAVHFVDLAEHDLTDIKYSDYSASKDGSVKAWMDGTELYIGGYGKIIAGERLRSAFWHGDSINSITGLEMLDTSNVTDTSFMFYACGLNSKVFTLDLGDKFDTSKVKDMSYMFYYCGCYCDAFTLDLGTNFDTSKVNNMAWMFFRCGENSKAFTTLDLSSFKVVASTSITNMASQIPVTTFIFGEGWAGAKLPTAGSSKGAFYASSETDTVIVGATENLLNYDWASDNRTLGGSKPKTYTVTATAETGGTVSGGGTVCEGESITLTATANDGCTFEGWYDGETKVCGTAEFTVENVGADKTYTAKFAKDATEEPSEFDFTTIRTLRAKDIVVNHKDKTIAMTADGNVRNIAVYHDQLSVIPGGKIKLADAKEASVKQNSGSFYIISNAGTSVVTVDVTIGDVTKQYTLSVNFNEFVAENLRMYQRKLGSTQKDIVYGTDVGYVVGNEIYITPDAGIEYIGLTKYQGTPGNYSGIITPVAAYPTYSTFEESTTSDDPVFVDWQGCIFVKRPTDGKTVEIDVNYTLGTETSVYKVIVDFSEEPVFAFTSIRTARAKNIVVDHSAKTITMDSDGRVANIAVYKYQLAEQGNMQITLADKLDADITRNTSSFYIKNNGTGTVSVLADITMSGTTLQYTLTVNFEDGFDFTDIRTLRASGTVIDHENKTITVNSDGKVANIAVYKAQNDVIKDGSIVLADTMNADVVQNAGSFYIKDSGTGSATVSVDITIGKVTKRYSLTVNFSDGFDFDNIRTLRVSEIEIDHNAKKITVTASKGVKNVALYISQTGVISGGRLTITDEKDSKVLKNPGSYYIIKQDENGKSSVSANITIGGKTKTYEITVCFAD